ncbi:FapA family protein [Paenibacillus wulumuqiensis]|uniref:FapA family protein n=1 Tax=Paenibacillus wulumuqiensis TaxID=1567107 RepID=UPI00061950D9|nr:FapA family protein [Paenibacillus wulumuqiensis]
MERNVISKGKTVEQAVDRALALLGAKKEEVSIEVIDSENRGFLGLNSKPAVVKVSLLATSIPQPTTFVPPVDIHGEMIPASLDGRVIGMTELTGSTANSSTSTLTELAAGLPEHAPSKNIQEEGKIWVAEGRICINIPAGGSLPIIDAFKSEDVVINGRTLLAGQSAAVSGEDSIEVKLDSETKDAIWQLDIAKDGMTATLKIEPGYCIVNYLVDTEPDTRLMLRVAQKKIPAAIDPEVIYQQLTDLNIIFGIDQSVIEVACRADKAGSFVIASGRAPIHGHDGMFELKTNDTARKVQPKLRENGTIDYRETREFPSILEGEMIGTIIPAYPGTDGIDIYGNRVQAPAVHDIQIVPGKDVMLSEDKLSAIALKSGMPSPNKQGRLIKLSIIPKLMHNGDVDLATGNIHFQGDVEISGAVQDTMQVEAEGNIRVRGNVNMAQITAGNSLIVHANILSSKVVVGQLQLFHGQVAPMLMYLREQTELLKKAVRQVSGASAFKLNDMNQTGLAPLFQVLFQGRFKWMMEQLQRLMTLEEQYQSTLKEEWTRYFNEIRTGFMHKESSHFRTAEDLEGFIRRTNYLYTMAVTPTLERNFARLHYIQSSTVRCGGDIIVEKGTYNAHLHCEGRLEAIGALRGGTYYAAEGMILQEGGSPGTGSTRLHVDAKGKIKAGKILAGTTIQVGERIYQFAEDAEHVIAQLDENNQLVWKGRE